MEGFIQDAKNELDALKEEKTQELTEARQRADDAEIKEAQEALKVSEAQLEALQNEKETVL